MKKLSMDLDSITVETFVPQQVPEAIDVTTAVCTRWYTCTNCDANSCIC
jgi:hypothetical protein